MSLFNRNDKSNDIQPQSQADPPKPVPVPPPQPVQAARPAEPVTPTVKSIQVPTKTGAIMASVISKALKITGELESTEDIQIDGQIEGDVRGVGVKIGHGLWR
jgi:hypothetical protein